MTTKPLPVTASIPPDDDYLAIAHWREILDAAITVGRDLTPWIRHHPGLAQREIAARQSPLNAYIALQPSSNGVTRREAAPNLIYRRGTEASARSALGYHVGMTMAEWACRRLLGLGPTTHAEFGTPRGATPGWRTTWALPDLYGEHRKSGLWLVEAKGSRVLNVRSRRKGAEQLDVGGVLPTSHHKVLCGTSLESRLFMMIDVEEPEHIEAVPTGTLDLRENDDALLAVARQRMLVYHTLMSLPTDALQLVAVSRPQGWEQGPGELRLLENDGATRDLRAARSAGETTEDEMAGGDAVTMLVGQVPGTGLKLGLSRRLFDVCGGYERGIDQLSLEPMMDQIPRDYDEVTEIPADVLETRFLSLAYRDHGDRDRRLRQELRTLFTDRRLERRSWRSVRDVAPDLTEPSREGFLEAASADAYIALDAASMPMEDEPYRVPSTEIG